jgi:hypothetical protein
LSFTNDRDDGSLEYSEYGEDSEEYRVITDDDAKSYCQPYHGVACASYIGGQNIYVSRQFQQGNVDEAISGLYEILPSALLMLHVIYSV